MGGWMFKDDLVDKTLLEAAKKPAKELEQLQAAVCDLTARIALLEEMLRGRG